MSTIHGRSEFGGYCGVTRSCEPNTVRVVSPTWQRVPTPKTTRPVGSSIKHQAGAECAAFRSKRSPKMSCVSTRCVRRRADLLPKVRHHDLTCLAGAQKGVGNEPEGDALTGNQLGRMDLGQKPILIPFISRTSKLLSALADQSRP